MHGSVIVVPLKLYVLTDIRVNCTDPEEEKEKWKAVPLSWTDEWNEEGIMGENRVKDLQMKLNSMVRVRKRTIPTERQPLVGDVIANFCG
jgi:hypothetical protein